MKAFKLELTRWKQERVRAYLFNIGLLLIPIVCDLLFPNIIIKEIYYYGAGAFIFGNLIREIFRETIVEINFDHSSQQIGILKESLFSKTKQILIPFDKARLEFTDDDHVFIFQNQAKLCFMKDKVKMGCITASRNGFSKETILHLISEAKTYKLPITNI